MNFSPGWSSGESEVSSVCQHSDVSAGNNAVNGIRIPADKGSGLPTVVYKNFDGSQQTADGSNISFPETSSFSEVGLYSPGYRGYGGRFVFSGIIQSQVFKYENRL